MTDTGGMTWEQYRNRLPATRKDPATDEQMRYATNLLRQRAGFREAEEVRSVLNDRCEWWPAPAPENVRWPVRKDVSDAIVVLRSIETNADRMARQAAGLPPPHLSPDDQKEVALARLRLGIEKDGETTDDWL